MFELYTEKARRTIFFARYEASQFGLPYIETEHLLLGLLREDKVLTNRFLSLPGTAEAIRKQIEERTTLGEKIPTSVDLPLTDESKYVLAYAAEEAERLSHKYIGTEHLLLGLLRGEDYFAAKILQERGLRLQTVREELQRKSHKILRQKRDRGSSLLAQFSRDLTEAAFDNLLEPLVGHDNVVKELLEVLCSRVNRNPLLICAPSVAGNSIVELLAQMIADGEVPTSLQNKQLLALDLEQILEADSKLSNERLTALVKEIIAQQDCIVFINEVHRLTELDPFGRFRWALTNGQIQCIGTTTAVDHERAVRNTPWIGRCFRNIRVGPMQEDDVIKSLHARKYSLEKFHVVGYADEAIEFAVRYSTRYFSNEGVLEKAMEMLDIAGTRVKLRWSTTPEEVVEVQKRIKFIVHRMEMAVAK